MSDLSSSPHSAQDLVPTWVGLVDDAAIFPPGNAAVRDAEAAYVARRSEWYADFAGPLVVTDTRIGELGQPLPLAVVVTGGAGAVEPAARLAAKHGHDLQSLEIALRDLDDLAGNARRVMAAVDAAVASGSLSDAVSIHIEIPPTGSDAAWLAAADVVAESAHRLKFRTGGLEAHLFPSPRTLAEWINAALDRELQFKCTAGLHQAIRHTDPETGFTHHGFLNILTATSRAFDEGATVDETERLLSLDDPAEAISEAFNTRNDVGRRWFTSFGCCSVTEPLQSLIDTGMLEDL